MRELVTIEQHGVLRSRAPGFDAGDTKVLLSETNGVADALAQEMCGS